MSEIPELLNPPRFPGDDYVIRMNYGQLMKLCTLMKGIKSAAPEQFEDPEIAMLELHLAHQAYVHNSIHGDDACKAFASKILPQIRQNMTRLATLMGGQ